MASRYVRGSPLLSLFGDSSVRGCAKRRSSTEDGGEKRRMPDIPDPQGISQDHTSADSSLTNSAHIVRQRWKDMKRGHTAPHFTQNGHSYQLIERSGLILAVVCCEGSSPLSATDFLTRLYTVMKDMCGGVSEAIIKANTFLVEELLDEIVVKGQVQLTNSDKLWPFIQSDVTIPSKPPTDSITARLFGIDVTHAGSRSTTPKHSSSHQGVVSRVGVSGEVVVRSYLTGVPQLQVTFCDDLTYSTVGQQGKAGYESGVHLERCQFHPSLDQTCFDQSKIISLHPSPGETTVMSYFITTKGRITLPFIVSTSISDITNSDTQCTLSLRSQYPGNVKGIGVTVHIPTSPHVTAVSHRLLSNEHRAEFVKAESVIKWYLGDFPGSSDIQATFRLMSNTSHKPRLRGPIIIDFELSGHVCSGLRVRSVKVSGTSDPQTPPKRWVRYATVGDSYMCHVDDRTALLNMDSGS